VLRLLGGQRGRVRVRVGITVDLESTEVEEWKCDAAHAAAPLRTQLRPASLGLPGSGGAAASGRRRAAGRMAVCGQHVFAERHLKRDLNFIQNPLNWIAIINHDPNIYKKPPKLDRDY
jgi:hypothetical protein